MGRALGESVTVVALGLFRLGDVVFLGETFLVGVCLVGFGFGLTGVLLLVEVLGACLTGLGLVAFVVVGVICWTIGDGLVGVYFLVTGVLGDDAAALFTGEDASNLRRVDAIRFGLRLLLFLVFGVKKAAGTGAAALKGMDLDLESLRRTGGDSSFLAKVGLFMRKEAAALGGLFLRGLFGGLVMRLTMQSHWAGLNWDCRVVGLLGVVAFGDRAVFASGCSFLGLLLLAVTSSSDG